MDKSFWDNHGNQVEAAIIMLVAIGIALAVDRFVLGRAVRKTEEMETQQFSREARTRLRLIRRLVFVAIISIGAFFALSQFDEIRRLTTGLLASTAVLGLVVGFAARPVIGNFVAGVLMAIRQPIRLGDRITIGDDVHGRVSDIALTFTSVDQGDGSLLVVPNEKVVTEVVINHSAGNWRSPVAIDAWLDPDGDIEEARRALEATDVTSVRVAETTAEGVRLELKAGIEAGRDREARAAEVREAAHKALREAGVLPGAGTASA